MSFPKSGYVLAVPAPTREQHNDGHEYASSPRRAILGTTPLRQYLAWRSPPHPTRHPDCPTACPTTQGAVSPNSSATPMRSKRPTPSLIGRKSRLTACKPHTPTGVSEAPPEQHVPPDRGQQRVFLAARPRGSRARPCWGLQIQNCARLQTSHHPCRPMVHPTSQRRSPTPSRHALGIASQEFYKRKHAPDDERRNDDRARRQRDRETLLWPRATERLGSAPKDTNVRWVRVANRGADIETFLRGCVEAGQGFVVRACYNRKLLDPQGQAACTRWPPVRHGSRRTATRRVRDSTPGSCWREGSNGKTQREYCSSPRHVLLDNGSDAKRVLRYRLGS